MTKRSPFVEHSWRCCTAGCKDYLTLSRLDLNEPPDPENRAMYLLFNWDFTRCSRWSRVRRLWRILRNEPDDWYEFSIEEPHVARQIAEALLLGAAALEREQARIGG